MKKLLLTVATILVGVNGFSQTINTYPFIQDFEAEPNGGTACDPTHTFVAGSWTNGDDAMPASVGHTTDWTVDVGGTGSGGTGPSVDHTLGNATGKYIYAETSCSALREFHLVSPYMNFTTSNANLNFWYHAFGATIGDLVIDARVGSLGAWDLDLLAGPITGNVDIWQEQTVGLSAYYGMDSVQVRLRYIQYGADFTGDLGLDDIEFFVPSDVDLLLASTTGLPASGCGLGLETVTATISESGLVGLVAGDTLFINYNDGTTVINDTVVLVADLIPGANYVHTFSQTIDFSVTGTYNVIIDVYNMQDPNLGDNVFTTTVNSIPLISTFPYLENYDNGNGGWTATNIANSSWDLTTPNNVIINGASSDTMAWVTNATGLYNASENGYVASPCFDFSTLDSSAAISMDVWWNSEFSWDGANVTASTDGGSTWNLVGGMGDSDNWYNDNTINGAPGGFQQGWTGRNSSGNGSGGWVTACHKLEGTGLNGQSSVMFRVNFGSDGSVQDEGFAFDNFQVGYPTQLDTMMADFVGCAPFTTIYGSVGTYTMSVVDTNTMLEMSTMTSTSGVQEFTNGSDSDSTFLLITTYKDYLGCSTIDSVLVTMYATPYNDLMDVTLCEGTMTTFAVDTSSNYTYLWNDMSSLDSLVVGTQGMVSVMVSDTVSGCAHSDSAMVTVISNVDLPATVNVCGTDAVVLDAGMYDVYGWSTGAITQTISVTIAGNYFVDVMDTISGCSSSDTIIVTTSALPMPSITGEQSILCANHVMTLDAGTGFSAYSWTSGGSAQSELIDGSTLPLGSNTVLVSVTDANGCMNSDSVTFVVDACAGVENLNAIQMTVYPNPSAGVFNYTMDAIGEGTSIVVVDLAGKLIYQEEAITKTGTIDLSVFDRGTYIATFKQGALITVLRLVKN